MRTLLGQQCGSPGAYTASVTVSPTGSLDGSTRRSQPSSRKTSVPVARSTTSVTPQPPEPPRSANTIASADPSPVTSATWLDTPSTGSRRAGNAVPQTGRQGSPPSSNRRQAAMPRSCRKGSVPGTLQATTIASPAAVEAVQCPVTSAPIGISAAAGTLPGGTSSSNEGGRPAGSEGSGEGDGATGAGRRRVVAREAAWGYQQHDGTGEGWRARLGCYPRDRRGPGGGLERGPAAGGRRGGTEGGSRSDVRTALENVFASDRRTVHPRWSVSAVGCSP